MIEKLKKYKKIFLYIGTIIVAIVFLLLFIPSSKTVYNERFFSKVDSEYNKEAVVLEIVEKYEEKDYWEEDCDCYLYRCKITKGSEEYLNKEVLVIQKIEKIYAYKYREAKVGNKIYIAIGDDITKFGKHPEVEWAFTGQSTTFNRIIPLIVLVVLFVVAIIAFSRLQGVNTLIALGLSIAVIFIVFIPKVISGGNVYFWTFISFLYVVWTTLTLVIGFNKKAFCALCGCLGGLIVITILTLIARGVFSLTGNYDTTSDELVILARDLTGETIDMQAVIFSIITLGSMGALLDVGISLSSSLYEVSLKAASAKEIIKSGFVIGKDMLGTMTNTLILAYLGTSLPLVIYDILYYTLEGIMVLEVVYIEIIQSLVGTLGMLSAIPITSFICGFIYTKYKTEKQIGIIN